MEDPTLDNKKIKELTDFLPLLYDKNIKLSKQPGRGKTDKRKH